MNTSDNSEKATMNFFLGSTEKKQLGITDSTNSKSDTYIIIQNDKLHAEVVELRAKLVGTKTQLDEMENDADRSDQSVRYLKGLQKNLVVIEEDTKKVCNQYKFLHDASKDMNDKFAKHMTNMEYVVGMAIFTLGTTFVSSFLGYVFAFFTFVTLSGTFYGVTKLFLKFDRREYRKFLTQFNDYKNALKGKLIHISTMEKDIMKTKESLPTLLDHIDNV